MMEEMGEDNIFIFGMKVDEVEALRKKGLILLIDCLSVCVSVCVSVLLVVYVVSVLVCLCM